MINTIADIAKIAGVSKSTVSRALNDNPSISKNTREFIKKIAEENKFETHQAARNLSLNKSNTIALIFPKEPLMNDPFLVELIQGITATVSEYGYDLLIVQPGKDYSYAAFSYLNSKRADGIIIFGIKDYLKMITSNLDSKSPVVSWGQTLGSYSSVDCDNFRGGYLAASHLAKTGCRKIVFLGGIRGETEVVLRYKGYKKALTDNGLEMSSEYVVYGDYTKTSGYEKIKKLLTSNNEIDGIFSSSDLMAIGAMEAIKEADKRIPDDIGIVGFDNIMISEYCNPSLTTITQDIKKGGEMLVHSLMKYLKDGTRMNTVLPVNLVIRNSTKSIYTHN